MEKKKCFLGSLSGIGAIRELEDEKDIEYFMEKLRNKLEGKDKVIDRFQKIGEEDDRILCITKKGFGYIFNLSDMRVMGEDTEGIKIIKLTDGDSLVDFIALSPEIKKARILLDSMLDIDVDIKEIPVLTRGSQGVKIVNFYEQGDTVHGINKVY